MCTLCIETTGEAKTAGNCIDEHLCEGLIEDYAMALHICQTFMLKVKYPLS